MVPARTPARPMRGLTIVPADCSYYFGGCAGPGEMVCEFTDDAGICVGEGFQPVVGTCDGVSTLSEISCSAVA